MHPPNTNCLLVSRMDTLRLHFEQTIVSRKERETRSPPDFWCSQIDSSRQIHGKWQSICFSGQRLIVSTGRQVTFTSVHLVKTLKLSRASFSSVCSIKTVAKAFQNLKLQLIIQLSIKRIKTPWGDTNPHSRRNQQKILIHQ